MLIVLRSATLFDTAQKSGSESSVLDDALRRLVETNDGSVVAAYSYDGNGWRIQKTVGENTFDYYFNTSWQVIEERINGNGNPYAQYLWDIRYIDSAVMRWRDGNCDGDYSDAQDGVLYYLNDANMNVTAVADASTGSVVERYVYEAYGQVSYFDGSWNSQATSSYDNRILYCGYSYNYETGLYHVRHREYSPALGRWIQRDPLGYVDGMGLYQYVRSSPAGAVDRWGTATESTTSAPATQATTQVAMPEKPLPAGPEGRYDVDLKKEPITGKAREWEIVNPDIRLESGASGRVRVYSNVWYSHTVDRFDGDDGSIVLEFRLHEKGEYKKGDCRWIQFVYSETNSNRNYYGTGYGYYRYGAEHRYVDSSHASDAYYDRRGVSTSSDVEATIIDKPRPAPRLLQTGEYERSVFDSILVCCGKPVYMVHWEHQWARDSEGAYDEAKCGFFNIRGEPISKMPWWASSAMLLSGYRDEGLTQEQARYNNPVPKKYWTIPTTSPATAPAGTTTSPSSMPATMPV